MKKTLLFSLLILFLTSFTFAISDITLHMDGDDIVIKKNKDYKEDEKIGEINNENILKLYDDEDEKLIIYEDEKFIYISPKNTIDEQFEIRFSKTNGNPVYIRDGTDSEILDENTGLKISETRVSGNEYSTIEYFYNNDEEIIKEILTEGQIIDNNLENKKIDYISISEYNDFGIQTQETCYNSNNQVLYEIEFDNEGNRIKEKDYDEQNNIIYEILYQTTKTSSNSRINSEIQRRRFNKKTQEYETWEKIPFDKDKKIIIENNVYICNIPKDYSTIEKSIDKTIEWDNYNFAKIKKIDITKITEYKYLENLQKQKKYIGYHFSLFNDNTNTYFYINYDLENFEIDLNSCIEIQLINKKEFNYADLNLSGNRSGPFGFDIGMTYDEVKAACNGVEPEHIGDDRYYVKPIKSHPDFEKYVVWISPVYGLYYIKGIGSFISTTDNGKNIKNKYNNLLKVLEKKYGKYFGVNFLNPNYNWNEDSNWLEKLKNKDIKYHSYFNLNYENYDGLDFVLLGIDTTDTFTITDAYIFIEYEFYNHEASKELLNDVL